ncbi:diguanylate cyclase (GGDEF)-like protein [Actinoplanes lutulentus]|uniref:Diguanylate cyclase (GGDEF)-like protein n=1 Tax=Actinoplanes lutulentus TaxID=1287878 RepID=A0A327Z2N8_9ACTN|nr:GGDEF domain-containing protein [Actinoplanes lutulentus]MBB2943825.1 diguanylate cyclase (GGDEF)-like protein [Actinoplanes lutulentus]RAK29367.1 diguanylate cyclase (GGDEF)-like protein [Actinoplanes lutulentus]
MNRLWSVYLLIGAVLVVSAAATRQPWGEVVLTGAEISAGLVVIVAIRRRRPPAAASWWLLAAALLAFAATHVTDRIGTGTTADVAAVACAFTLFTAAMLVRVRHLSRPGQHRANLVDGLIVMLCLLAGIWAFITGPFLMERWGHLPALLTFILFNLLGLVRTAAGAVLLLAGDPRDRVNQLLMASVALQLAGDTTYASGLADNDGTKSWQVACWVFGHLIAAAAALHPHMARIEPGRDTRTISRTRLWLFSVLTALNPLMTGLAAALRPHDGPPPQPENELSLLMALNAFMIPLLLSVAVSVLLLLRMGGLGNLAQRRADALDAALREQDELRAELEHRATHDPLTGLGNRAAFTDGLAAAMATPHGGRGWLILVDLDGFKEVNDTFGHPVGDELLVALGGEFRAAVPSAAVARLGGDEFAVLIPGEADAPPAAPADGDLIGRDAVAAASVLLDVAARERLLSGNRIRVSASIGLLDLNDAAGPSEALRDADVALYAAKTAGRACSAIYNPVATGAATTAR